MASDSRTPWWLWPNLLNLDSPLLAVIWQEQFARISGANLARFAPEIRANCSCQMTASNGESKLSRLGQSHHGVRESDATGWVEPRSGPGSGNDFLQDTAPDIGQLTDAASVLEVDVLLVEAHEVENGRVHVADVNGFTDAA